MVERFGVESGPVGPGGRALLGNQAQSKMAGLLTFKCFD